MVAECVCACSQSRVGVCAWRTEVCLDNVSEEYDQFFLRFNVVFFLSLSVTDKRALLKASRKTPFDRRYIGLFKFLEISSHMLQPSVYVGGFVICFRLCSLWLEQLDSQIGSVLSHQGPSNVTLTPSGRQKFGDFTVAIICNGEWKKKRWKEMISRDDESTRVTWHSHNRVKDRADRVDVILSLAVHCLACRDEVEREPEKQCEIRLSIYLFSLSSFSLLPKEEDWLTDAPHHHLHPRLWASFVWCLPPTRAN